MPKPKTTQNEISVEPAKDGIQIAELYKNMSNYNGETVRIRGQVVKVNEAILHRNWIHLQDGSEFEGKFDLTVTMEALPNVGEIITIEGKVALNKDFGAGYTYDMIVEEAVIR